MNNIFEVIMRKDIVTGVVSVLGILGVGCVVNLVTKQFAETNKEHDQRNETDQTLECTIRNITLEELEEKIHQLENKKRELLDILKELSQLKGTLISKVLETELLNV